MSTKKINTGWTCPVCGGGMAPTATRCPCVTLVPRTVPQTPWMPGLPIAPPVLPMVPQMPTPQLPYDWRRVLPLPPYKYWCHKDLG